VESAVKPLVLAKVVNGSEKEEQFLQIKVGENIGLGANDEGQTGAFQGLNHRRGVGERFIRLGHEGQRFVVDHDHVRGALDDAGGQLDFWKIAMRPGKPLIAGRIGDAILLGLPGNPSSAFVTATLFLLPLVRYLAGVVGLLQREGYAPRDTDEVFGFEARRNC